MNSNLFLLLLLGHILADYYFQNEELANKKREKLSHLFGHSTIHLITYLLLVLLFWNKGFYLMAIAASVSHFIIDLIKYLMSKAIDSKGSEKLTLHLKNLEEQGWLYSLDQLFHLVALIALGFGGQIIFGTPDKWSLPGIAEITLSTQALKYIIAVLVILKPANVTFRQLFRQHKPSEVKVSLDKDMKAGQQIGNMERLLMLALLSLGQYTAIALVFTAKSVTRYNRIANEQAFAEYYLLGTLYSILVVIVVHIVGTLI